MTQPFIDPNDPKGLKPMPTGGGGHGQQFLTPEGIPGQAPGTEPEPHPTAKAEPVGWGDKKPEHTPEMPEFMPGPSEWEVTPEQTVAGQMEKNLSKDSPLNEQIHKRVQSQAQRAGMANSLMAATAGEMMVIDQAFKISSQDAATFARSAEFNAVVKNQFAAAEQEFMHQAMLSDQNFKQASVLQKEQIAGQLKLLREEIKGKERLADKAMDHWFQQNEQLHSQNVEIIGMNHELDLQRMGVIQDLDLERMAFQTEAQMALSGWNADLQMAANDRNFFQQLQMNEQQFGMQQQLNYQSHVSAMLQAELQSLGMIGGSGASSEQMSHAARQLQDRITAGIDMIGSLFASNSGPAASSGAKGDPSKDYMYFGPPVQLPGGKGMGATIPKQPGMGQSGI